jgi:hypothetical protein
VGIWATMVKEKGEETVKEKDGRESDKQKSLVFLCVAGRNTYIVTTPN